MSRILVLLPILICRVVFAAGGEITQDRAQQLADRYFHRSFPEIGCGGVFSPKKRLDYWALVVAVGYAPVASGTILVNRTTGDVSYDGPLGRRLTVSAATLDQWAAKQKATHKP